MDTKPLRTAVRKTCASRLRRSLRKQWIGPPDAEGPFVRQGRRRLRWAGLFVWLVSVQAGAIGLGDMVLTSPPGQPLEARIPVELVTARELWALQVGVASETTYLRDGRDRVPELDALNFEVVRGSDGGSAVRMSSPNPLVSSITVLVEATWLRRQDLPAGRLIRTYSFGPDDLPEPGAQPRPLGAGSLATYGPVQEGETLWSLAERFTAPAVHPNQILVAIFEANPRGFGGNMNGIYQGATLRIPEAVQARRLTVEQATAEAIRQLDEWLAELEATPSSQQGEAAASTPGTDQLQAELEGVRELLETRNDEVQALRSELEEARAAALAAQEAAAEARAAVPPPPPPGLRGLWVELNRAASRAAAATVVIGLAALLLFGILIGFLLGRRGGSGREQEFTPQPPLDDPADTGITRTEDAAAESRAAMDLESQLDLARAQVDMGDAAAASRTLRAVVTGGSKAQRQQAESLLQELESAMETATKNNGSDSVDDPR